MNDHASLKDKVPEPACPKCGKMMEPGFVASKATRLRWVDRRNTKTIFCRRAAHNPFLMVERAELRSTSVR